MPPARVLERVLDALISRVGTTFNTPSQPKRALHREDVRAAEEPNPVFAMQGVEDPGGIGVGRWVGSRARLEALGGRPRSSRAQR